MKPRMILTSILTALFLTVSAAGTAPAAELHHGVGDIKTIDLDHLRVEIDHHGTVKSLPWIGMTMFFDVEDRALLKKYKVGDKVNFEFSQTLGGRFVVTDMERKE